MYLIFHVDFTLHSHMVSKLLINYMIKEELTFLYGLEKFIKL